MGKVLQDSLEYNFPARISEVCLPEKASTLFDKITQHNASTAQLQFRLSA